MNDPIILSGKFFLGYLVGAGTDGKNVPRMGMPLLPGANSEGRCQGEQAKTVVNVKQKLSKLYFVVA